MTQSEAGIYLMAAGVSVMIIGYVVGLLEDIRDALQDR